MLRTIVCLILMMPTVCLADQILEVRNEQELAAAGKLLAEGDAKAPLMVRIAPGDYILEDSLRILRSNVQLTGDKGARLRLGRAVDKPVIVVGSQAEVPHETERIERIRISGIEIDGNREQQTSELQGDKPWIRNNGIDIRMVSHLDIEGVHVTACRSGGLVISWKTSDVSVKDSTFSGSHFDGVAYYDCERVETLRCAMKLNDAAGVSADNHFEKSRFVDCEITGNGDVGLFLRASRDILFDRCLIEDSKNWAAFLAHDDSGRGVHDIAFRECRIFANNGGIRMASLNETQSSGTEVTACEFARNNHTGRANIDTAGSPVRAEDNTEKSISF